MITSYLNFNKSLLLVTFNCVSRKNIDTLNTYFSSY